MNRPLAVALLLILASAASPGRCMSAAGHDRSRATCDYCGMIITDRRFGGKIETVDGRTLVFDATECLAAYDLTETARPSRIRARWSACWDHPGAFVPAERAWYVQSDSIPSPMAVNLSAFRTAEGAAAARRARDGRLLRWNEVQQLVWQRWLQPFR